MEFPLMEQKSPEWFALRENYITASNFDTVMSGGQKAWEGLIKNLNSPPEHFYSKHTQWGIDHEDEAIALFEFLTGTDTYKMGFISHDKYKAGCSPDFLVNAEIGGEVKCPSNSANHYAVMMSQKVPKDYMAQVQGSMWVTGRKQWWYLNYDPRQRPEHRLVKILVDRDEDYIAKLERKVLNFLRVWKEAESASKYFCNLDGAMPKLF